MATLSVVRAGRVVLVDGEIPDDILALYHGCLLVVGPEPLGMDRTRRRGRGQMTRASYRRDAGRFFEAAGVDIDTWQFIYWTRTLLNDDEEA